ncbi:MAG: hypothetical protein AAF738_09040, partial [Bacteroidota bacterium]
EIGHILGLQHAWTKYDGCEDTPQHPNCWTGVKSAECGESYSNNMMDYNAVQNALTPCQIGRMHRNMSDLNHRSRKMLEPTWCRLDTQKTVVIRDSVHWEGAHDLEGHVYIKNGGFLRVACRLSLPKGAKIVLDSEATLVLDNAHLHNACEDKWEGIELISMREQRGLVQLLGDVRLEDMVHQLKSDNTSEMKQ